MHLCFAILLGTLGGTAALNADFNCDYNVWQSLYDVAPNLWSPQADLSPQDAAPSGCRHCWWDLGYPTSGKFVFARQLNCTLYAQTFGSQPKTLAAFRDLFMSRNAALNLPNFFFSNLKLLDGDSVAALVDLNKDGSISLEEFLVAMHFWAPISLAQFGPSASSVSYSSSIQILGGFFYTSAPWATYLSQAASITQSTTAYLTQARNNTDWLLTMRAPQTFEAENSFSDSDVDGSSRYSIIEHYFSIWADKDGDGFLSEAEYTASLFFRPSPATPLSTLDIDLDGQISFYEIKFWTSSGGGTGLSKTDWIKGDFDPNLFEIQNLDSGSNGTAATTIETTEYRKYLAFQTCSSGPAGAPSSYWDGAKCFLHLSLAGDSPYVNGVGDGFLPALWSQLTKNLNWISQLSVSPVSSLPSDFIKSAKIDDGTVNTTLALFSFPAENWRNPTTYICSDPLGDNDAMSIMSLLNPAYISLELVILEILITPSFLRFLAIIFLSTIVVGHLIWLAEHRENPQFNRYYVQGVLDGLYFSIVTLTTVGYGDKGPITGIGKIITIVWMFVSVISFSIFSGEATNNISTLREAKVITGTEKLPKKDIGVLTFSVAPDFSSNYGYTAHIYDSVDDAAKALLRGSVQAVIAPNTMIVNYFKRQGYDDAVKGCDNPFIIVGSPLDPVQTNTVCCLRSSGYACPYLISNINAGLAAMKSNNQWTSLVSTYLGLDFSGADCSAYDPYPYANIFIAIGLLVFFGSLALLLRLYNRRKRQLTIKTKAINIFKSVKATKEQSARKYGLLWLKRTREGRDRRHLLESLNEISSTLERYKTIAPLHSEENCAKLRFSYERFGVRMTNLPPSAFTVKTDPLLPLLQDMRTSMAEMRISVKGLGSDIHSLHKEAFEHRRQLSKVITFFSVVNMASFILTAFAVAVLIVVWGGTKNKAK